MKKAYRILLSLLLAGALAASLTGCAKIGYVANGTKKAINDIRTGEWKRAQIEAAMPDVSEDKPVIDAFTPGTYGGIEMKTVDDLVKCYASAFDKTKAKTKKWKDSNGNTQIWYAFGGTKAITINDILVDGKSNGIINKLVPQLLGSLYKPTLSGLQPSMNEDPTKDKDEFGESLLTCRVTADDLLAANVTDNGDGTITLKMQPKMTEMSHCGVDAQGRMFTSLNDLGSVVDAVSVFSWAQGTTEENCKVIYKDGVAEITIDTKSDEIVKANYTMKAYVSIQHANLSVVHDKSVTATVDYVCIFPADQSFYDSIGIQPLE